MNCIHIVGRFCIRYTSIDFKILLLTYKALNGLAPAYLREQLVPYFPTRTLRSKENHQLTSPRCRLENFGRRSFAAAAPMLWNNLPLNIKRSPSLDIFKSRTKTHLFQLAYFAWLFKCICECLVMLLFHVMYLGIGRFSFCSYATRIFTSALVSKGQISVCNICPILKPALYKYHIIINWRGISGWGFVTLSLYRYQIMEDPHMLALNSCDKCIYIRIDSSVHLLVWWYVAEA